jgi:hypothetical protein
MSEAMCHFCDKTFRNRQAVRAHLKGCPVYKQMPKATVPTLGSKPKTPSLGARRLSSRLTPEAFPTDDRPRHEPPRTTVDAEQEPYGKVLGRLTIQSVKNAVIDSWRSLGHTIPAETKSQALVAIEHELSRLPAAQLPRSELVAIAEGVRDRIYKPVLQAQERAREEEDRKRSQTRRRTTLLAAGEARANHTLRQQDGLDAWTRRELEQKVKRTLDQEIDGSESEADVEALVDDLVAKQLEPIQERAREQARQLLIEHGRGYVARELASEEDLHVAERMAIERDIKRDLDERVTGDESKREVEAFVDDVLDQVLGETEEEDEDEEENEEDDEEEESGDD